MKKILISIQDFMKTVAPRINVGQAFVDKNVWPDFKVGKDSTIYHSHYAFIITYESMVEYYSKTKPILESQLDDLREILTPDEISEMESRAAGTATPAIKAPEEDTEEEIEKEIDDEKEAEDFPVEEEAPEKDAEKSERRGPGRPKKN